MLPCPHNLSRPACRCLEVCRCVFTLQLRAVRLVLVLRPAHHLTAPSTEPWTRMYEAPVHPNRESKLPNPDSHQTHTAYGPHPTSHIVRTTHLASHNTRWTLPLPELHLCTTHTSHTSTAPRTTAHENSTDQPIAGIQGFVSSSHTREVTNTRTQASSDPVSILPNHTKPTQMRPDASSDQ
jgi:hypothetical protein